MIRGRNKLPLVIVAVAGLAIGIYCLIYEPELPRAKVANPSPREVAAFEYPLPTPSLMPDQINILATCEAYYLPTLQAVEDDLWAIQQVLVPGAATLVEELLKIPTRTPVGPSTSPTSTGTTVPSTPTPWGTQTRVPTPTYTPVSPFLCARLTADGCAKYGLIVKDCLSGYGAVCVRASNPNGDCQWCKNYRP